MSVVLPVALPTGAASWTVADYRRETLTTAPATGGAATAYGPQLDLDELWLVDRAVVHCTAADAELRLYESDPSVGRLLDGSDRGTFDVAEYPNGLLVQSGGQLVAVWTGVPDGSIGTCNVQLRVLRPAG